MATPRKVCQAVATVFTVHPAQMNNQQAIIKHMAESTTKDLPLGKPGARWKPTSRLSVHLNKTREMRQVLKENQVRYEKRAELISKKLAIEKNSRQIDLFPMPRHKETKKAIDYVAHHKLLFIHPKSITLTEEDLTKVTPEVLPLLGPKIRSMRRTGESWANITLALLQSYTSHLRGAFRSPIPL